MSSSVKRSYIGVFDSGVGGLSVLTQLIKDFPKESFVYLGDTARLPYGAKSKETIKNYVLKSIDFLNTNYNLKAVVVACNSASSVLDELLLPVRSLGVIEAGVLAAEKASKTKTVALWATRATVSSKAYELKSEILGTGLKIQSTACPTLVSLVEEGEDDHPLLHPAFDFYMKKSDLKPEVDTLILGCTHFPFFKENLKTYFSKLGLNINLVDASSETSQKLKSLIFESTDLDPEYLILVTDEAPHFKNFINSKMPAKKAFAVQKIDI